MTVAHNIAKPNSSDEYKSAGVGFSDQNYEIFTVCGW